MSKQFDDMDLSSIDNIELAADVDTPETKPAKAKKDVPTPTEVEQMSDEEIKQGLDTFADDEVKGLYQEFSQLLDKQQEIQSSPDNVMTIPTGIKVMDAILGGGFVVGKLNIVVGQPGCGKSMIAMQAAGRAQIKYKNCIVMYLDAEESTTTKRLMDLGVKYPPIEPYTEMTVEKVFRIVESLCVFKHEKNIIDTPSVIIWDSIANTPSEKEQTITDPNQVIGYKARILTQLLPQYVSKCSKYNICLLSVNQLRDVIAMGPYSAPRDLKLMSSHKDMPGGNSLKFNTNQLLEMKTRSVLDINKFGFEGILVRGKCVKNKLFRPNVEFDIVGNFMRGFSNFWTSYNFLVETKRLKSGAWNYLVNHPTVKFRTKDALLKYRDDLEFRKAFDNEIDEAIQTEIINKYNDVESDIIDVE